MKHFMNAYRMLKSFLLKPLTGTSRTLRGKFMAWLFAFVVLYLGLTLGAYLIAERLIFQPPPPSYRDTNEIIKTNAPDGARISAIHLTAPDARYTILYSHGNGEDLGYARPRLESLRRLGFNVFAYDYRGYGTSDGRASEQNTYEDVTAAFNHLTAKLNTPSDRIILYGASLGGAVAIDLAAREKVAGLIIESSFVSAYRVMTGVPLFFGDKYRSASKLPRVRCPVLLMHGTKDEVISAWHGERLFAVANEPKRLLRVEGAGHNNLSAVAGAGFGRAVQDFAQSLDAVAGSSR